MKTRKHYAAAIHEAGHICAAKHFQSGIVYAAIDGDGGCTTTWKPVILDRQQYCQEESIIALAGHVAVTNLGLQNLIVQEQLSSDMDIVVHHLTELLPPNHSVDEYRNGLCRLLVAAHEIVNKLRIKVLTVANSLLETGRLTGPEIDELLGGVHLRGVR